MRFSTLILTSIVFTKTRLTISDIGSYEIFLFISGLLCSFWINGLIQSFLPLFKKNNTFGENNGKKSAELYNAFILILICSIIAIFLLLIFRIPIEASFNHSSAIRYFPLLLVYIFFSSPSFLTEYIYLLKNKPASILIYGSITFLLQFVIISLTAILNYGMYYCVAGLVMVTVIRFLWLLIILRRYAEPQFSTNFIREHIRFGYPLIVSALLGGSAQYIDGFLVMSRFDASAFAVFQYGAREFPLVLLMANAFSTSMIPEFTTDGNLKSPLYALKTRSAKLMHLLFPATIVLLLSSSWLYPRVFNENFIESARIFNIYLLLIISRLVFPQSVLIGLKKTRVIMMASVAELVVNIALSVLFIYLWGMIGVAFGTLIAYAVQKLIWMVYLRNKLEISPAEYIPLKLFSFYSVVLIAAFCLIF